MRAVETRKLVRITRVYLLLRTPSKFGEVISFYPLQQKDQNGESAVAALRRRAMPSARDRLGSSSNGARSHTFRRHGFSDYAYRAGMTEIAEQRIF